jgi:uncharacterized membrane protein YjjP (DUF1212 family)
LHAARIFALGHATAKKQKEARVQTTHTAELKKIEFVVELARRLHIYGTSAQRLEAAVEMVAERLAIDAEVWSNPTGMILSFHDTERGTPYRMTQVIRLEPGEVNLGRLAKADAIAEDVLAGKRDIAVGLDDLRALDRPPPPISVPLTILCFGLASASVTGLLTKTGWADLSTAAVLGILIGAITIYTEKYHRWVDAHEAISAFIVTLIASAIAAFIAPLSLQGVVIAALIVLMPGLTLTTAITELSARQLVSGTARFAGALTILLKLAFGTVAATQLVAVFGWVPLSNANSDSLPVWMPWITLLAGSFAFSVLFKTARRDVLLVMASVWLGYFATKLGAMLPGATDSQYPVGVFIASFVVTALGNAYGRYFNRPGALIRVPGIILLVPGSVGFRGFSFVFDHDLMHGLDLAFAVIAALIALLAGILFGNLLVSARRNL